MSSERCVHGCQPPYFGERDRPCKPCRDWHDQAMDRSYNDHVIEQASIADARIKPATDQEWAARLDEIAPVVSIVSSAFSHDFRSKPFIDSVGPYETL